MFNLCVDNTEVVFRSPVKSSFLSLLLSSQTACCPTQPSVQSLPLSATTQVHTSQSAGNITCWPTEPSVQSLPLSATTQVHTSQSAGNITHRRSYTNFVDLFAC